MAKVQTPEEYLDSTSSQFTQLNFSGLEERQKARQKFADQGFFTDLIPTAFRMSNTIGSSLSYLDFVDMDGVSMTEYGLPQKLEERGVADERIIEGAVSKEISSDEQLDDYLDDIRQQRKDMQTFRANPVWTSVAMLGTGIADPVNLLPGAGMFLKARRLGNIVRGAAAGYATGAITEGAAEGVIIAEQDTRDFDEIIPAMFLGGVVGAGVGGLGGGMKSVGEATAAAANKAIRDNLDMSEQPTVLDTNVDKQVNIQTKRGTDLYLQVGKNADEAELQARADQLDDGNMLPENMAARLRKEFADMDNRDSSAGAVEASPKDRIEAEEGIKEDEAIRGPIGKFINKATTATVNSNSQYVRWLKHLTNPVMNMATATPVSVRKGVGTILESPIIKEKNVKGETDRTALNRLIQQDYNEFRKLTRTMKNKYFEYAKRQGADRQFGSKTLGAYKGAKNNQIMDYGEFNKELHRAVAVGGGNHSIPEVQALARDIITRKNRLYNNLVERGLVTEGDVGRTAVEHITRVWNRDAIRKDFDNFIRLLRDNHEEHIKFQRLNRDAVQGDLDNAASEVNKLKAEKEANNLTKRVRDGSIPSNLHEIYPELSRRLKSAQDKKDVKEAEKIKNEVRSLLRNRLDKINKRIKKLEADNRSRQETIRDLDEDVGQNPGQWARNVANAILGFHTNNATLDNVETVAITGASSLNKPRTVHIPDKLLIDATNFRGEHYLHSNMEDNVGSYLRSSSQASRTQEALDGLGYNNFSDYVQDIKEDFGRRISELERRTKKGELTLKQQDRMTEQLVKEQEFWIGRTDTDKGELQRIFNAATGRSGHIKGAGSKFLHHLRQAVTASLLAGVTISSIPDIGMHFFKNGMLNTFRDGVIPMFRDFKRTKIEAEKLNDFNVAIELTGSELHRIAVGGNLNQFSNRSKLDIGFDTALDAFGKMTLMEYWNRFNRRLAARTTSAQMFRVAKRFAETGNIKQRELERFANLNISKDDLIKINRAFEKYGEEVNGSFVMDYEKWDLDSNPDPDLDLQSVRAKFTDAVAKEVDSTIILPTAGDVPTIFQDNELLKTIFQFKSFASAAFNKIVMNAASRRMSDPAMAHLVITMPILGAVSGMIKDKINGNEDNIPDDLESLAKYVATEGYSRSGVTTVYGDVGLSITNGLGLTSQTRYATQNLQNQALGPSFGWATDLIESVSEINGDDPMTEYEKEKLMRVIPFVQYARIVQEVATVLGDQEDDR